jgi:hypothetical protein
MKKGCGRTPKSPAKGKYPCRATFAVPLRFAPGITCYSTALGQEVCVRAVKTKSAFSKYRGIGNPGIGSGRKNIGMAARTAWGMTTAVPTNVIPALGL